MIPKAHIKNVGVLRAGHVEQLQRMKALGERVMKANFGDEGRYVFHFHNPPFNSIDHLHLHCFQRPFNNCLRAVQNNDFFCWTSDIDDVMKAAASKL